MKSMTKLMVFALMVVLTAVLITPASAARASPTAAVASGETIFVYEDDLNFTFAVDEFRYYPNGLLEAPTEFVPASTTMFDVGASAFPDVGTGGRLYYAFNGGVQTGNVVVKQPSLTFTAVIDDASDIDSVNGQTVTRATNLSFKIGSNVPTAFTGTSGYNGTVEATTPNGGKLTTFGGQAMAQVDLSGSTTKVEPIVLSDVSAGTYTVLAKWASGTDLYKEGANSNTVSFTVSTKAVSIESNKETVVRGTNFVTTIQGESNHNYWVYVQDASVASDKTYPLLVAGQSGVTPIAVAARSTTITNDAPVNGTFANVLTTAGGSRPIEWTTATTTEDKTYTLRVVDATDATSPADDTIKVTVEKGAVTITAEGTGVFYLGEEITLSGTNTESDTTYLFMTGPNLVSSNGVSLEDISLAVNPSNAANTYTLAEVESDDTWEFEWDTGAILGGLPDAGTYTIYAASAPVLKDNVSDAQYALASVVLRKGFVTATVSNQVVAQGDDLTISGTAEGTPDQLFIWVFGKNYRVQTTADVEDDGTYEYDVDNTASLTTGQYFVIVHHPMGNGIFDIMANYTTGSNVRAIMGASTGTAPDFGPVYLSNLQASDAAQALIDALNSANVDDTYTRLTFLIEAPWITIDPVGDHSVGDTFTITGTTNLAEGDQLLYEIQSAAFSPTEKTTSGEFSGQTGTVEVQKGDAVNTWSFEVDASTFRPDQYIVTIESIEEAEASTSTTFNVVEAQPTTPTPTVTTTVVTTAPETTAPATTTATPVPTQPGFGALIALVGLGAVAFLVLRRH